MDSGPCLKRVNAKADRVSSLPDDLIHKILSFFDIKHAIKTSVLSSRWRFIWISMPYLNFSSEGFPSLPKFSKFVTLVLSRRNNEIDVSSVNLSFRFSGKVSQVFVKRILIYAFSHNVQHMTIRYLPAKMTEFPLSLFSSHSLKHLTLIDSASTINHSITFSSTWELPLLTTLHLYHVTLYDNHNSDKFSDNISKCTNLKNLTLNNCVIRGSNGLNICHPRLSNFTLQNPYFEVVSAVAPQLKNLYLVLQCHCLLFISDSLPSLDKVDLCISNPSEKDAHKIVGLLQQFHCVKFLTLNLEIVEILSASVELIISNQPSPFANLKSLKLYPVNIHLGGQAQKKANVSTDVINYLLDSSPSVTFIMVSREEIRAVRNTKLAQKHMAELQVLLDQEKEITNSIRMDRQKTTKQSHVGQMHGQGKVQVENKREQPTKKMPLHVGGKMAQIQRCWDDLNVQINLERARAQSVFSKLRYIEELLTELPASNRVKMQPCFTSLCAEASVVMKKVMDHMKIHCDRKRSLLSVYFHELATNH